MQLFLRDIWLHLHPDERIIPQPPVLGVWQSEVLEARYWGTRKQGQRQLNAGQNNKKIKEFQIFMGATAKGAIAPHCPHA